jgi:UDP-N-acetylglucosamine 4-epimerase
MSSASPDRPSRAATVRSTLRAAPARWLVTGAAGFIGSHLVEALLSLNQRVVGLDNLSTGSVANLDEALAAAAHAGEFELVEADIRDREACARACAGIDYVLHEAALGSVQRSLRDPAETNEVNVGGTINVLLAAREASVRRVVFASSSAVYGDDPNLPRVEGNEGRPLSPYAASKMANEIYAGVFHRAYGLPIIGLRYFNVFGARQNPEGDYAAVIPRWIATLLRGDPCLINGDGETSRDFCHVDNVVQANLLAAMAPEDAVGRAYNVAFGARTTLNQLYAALRDRVSEARPDMPIVAPIHEPFRRGDVPHSHADLSRVRAALGYEPTLDLARGLDVSLPWYLRQMS